MINNLVALVDLEKLSFRKVELILYSLYKAVECYFLPTLNDTIKVLI